MSNTNNKRYSLKQVVILLTIALSLATVLSYAAVTIPNTFTPGTTISSSQVNANFDAVKTAVDTVTTAAGAADTRLTAVELTKQDKPATGAFLKSGAGQVATAHMNCNATCTLINSYNPTGGAVSATTYSTGIGGITFAGMNVDNANIQVTVGGMYGALRSCRLTSGTSGDTVIVRCDDSAGTASYTDFYVLVIQ